MDGFRKQRVPSAYSQGRRHGLDPRDIEAVWRQQGEACAICRRPFPVEALLVDHDHELAALHPHDLHTGCRKCVRGLLCRNCNTNLGWFEQRVQAIVDYALSRRPRP